MLRRRLRVKEVAEARKLSMGKLSRKADLCQKTIKLIYDNPSRDITLDTLDKLAQALDVQPFDLIEYLNQRE